MLAIIIRKISSSGSLMKELKLREMKSLVQEHSTGERQKQYLNSHGSDLKAKAACSTSAACPPYDTDLQPLPSGLGACHGHA